MIHYTYSPLCEQHNEIRILDIVPGNSLEVHCRIKHARLSSNPPYEALSYCWGNPTLTNTIICDGQHLAITGNLFLAIRQLRHPTECRTIWADAVCINQEDVNERNSQVLLMRHVYQQAVRVLVWLGEAEDDSSLGLSLVPRLCDMHKQRADQQDNRRYEQLGDKGFSAAYGLPNAMSPEFRALFKLFQRPWFERGWVVQEVVVASQVDILCGESSVPFDDLITAVASLLELRIYIRYKHRNLQHLYRIYLTRQAFQEGKSVNLLTLLTCHQVALTSDPRDKVFAFCGLVARVGQSGIEIKPDYNMSVPQVYRGLAIEMITKERNLDILSISSESQAETLADLPSWVPDFGFPGTGVNPMVDAQHDRDEAIRYRTSLETQCSAIIQEGGALLGLDGFVFDTIAATSEARLNVQVDYDGPFWEGLWVAYAEEKMLIRWRCFVGLHTLHYKRYVTGEDLVDAYWQTLTAGCYSITNNGSKEEMREEFLESERHRHAYLAYLPIPVFECLLAVTFAIEFVIYVSKGLFFPMWIRRRSFETWTGSVSNRRIIKTTQGYIGLAYREAMIGDAVAVFKGSHLPLVLRAQGERWRLVGDCYLHGIMEGEAFEEDKCHRIWLV